MKELFLGIWAVVLLGTAISAEAGSEPSPAFVENAETASLVRAALVQPCTKRYDGCLQQNRCHRDARVCGDLGDDLELGIRDFSRDSRRALALHLHACAAGSPYSCVQAANRYRDGAQPDPEQELKLLRQGCMGTGFFLVEACDQLWRTKLANGTEADRNLGLQRLRAMCNDGHDWSACSRLCARGAGCRGAAIPKAPAH
jgi:hypothetical protein